MSRENEVILYTDGRHSSVYIYEPPMNKRIYTAPIDELVDLGIDTICYAVGDCRVLLYDTRAGERWGHNLKRSNHLIWYRAVINLARFIEDGHDPLQVVCERAHELGFNFIKKGFALHLFIAFLLFQFPDLFVLFFKLYFHFFPCLLPQSVFFFFCLACTY